VQQDISRLERAIGELKADHAKKRKEADTIQEKIHQKESDLAKKKIEYAKLAK
jgi:hypothetical protein